MSITVPMSPDPSVATVRTYWSENRQEYYETRLGPMELAALIGELSYELARIHQFSTRQASSNKA